VTTKLYPVEQDVLFNIFESQTRVQGSVDPSDIALHLHLPIEVTEINLISLHKQGLIVIDEVPDYDEPMGCVHLAHGVDARIRAELAIYRDPNWLDDLGRSANESSHHWLIRDAYSHKIRNEEKARQADEAKLDARAAKLKAAIATDRKSRSQGLDYLLSIRVVRHWKPQASTTTL